MLQLSPGNCACPGPSQRKQLQKALHMLTLTGLCREKIEELAGSLKFPLTKLFVIDGSTRSAHSNAYM